MAPVAAEIIPGRPPEKAMMIAIEKEAYRPTFGSTPAMIENEIASGISASATTSPDKRSVRGRPIHSLRRKAPCARAAVRTGKEEDIGAFGGRANGRTPPFVHVVVQTMIDQMVIDARHDTLKRHVANRFRHMSHGEVMIAVAKPAAQSLMYG